MGAPDIRQHWLAYFGHWSNFHMAFMAGWPSGTAHYWTLAIQVQFYLLWPLVAFGIPRRFLAAVFLGCVALAPVSRMILARQFPEIHHSEMITFTAMDYFGVGALLALAIDRGMKVGDGRLNLAAAAAFAGYIVLYVFSELGRQVAGFCYIQQTLVSVVFAGLISATLAGFGGFREKILNHPAVQHVGRLSFGLYLFHTPVPLLLGFVLPWLWGPFFTGFWQILRLGVFGLTSWGLAWLCWRYLETRPASQPGHFEAGQLFPRRLTNSSSRDLRRGSRAMTAGLSKPSQMAVAPPGPRRRVQASRSEPVAPVKQRVPPER